MKARRWWQRACPFGWYDLHEDGATNYWHSHYCRLEGSGELHEHVCDCGATVLIEPGPSWRAGPRTDG